MNLTQRNKQTILVVVVLIAFFGVLWTFAPRNAGVDTPPEGTSTNPDTQAVMTNGEEVIKAVGGVDEYDFLKYDLFFFAKTAYAAYQGTDETVGFVIKSDVKNVDGTVRFDGQFGSVENKISVAVRVLRNDRISVSITDTETKLKIDEFLPSNTKRNQFIGSLPLSTEAYSIDYEEDTDGFIISLYSETLAATNAAYDEAEQKLKEGLGVADLSEEIVQVSRPSSSFGF